MILDADILVDLVRGHPAALAWLKSLSTMPPAAGIAALEVLYGCQNRQVYRSVERFLRPFPRAWPTEADLVYAQSSLIGYWLSDGLGMADAIIAATALGLRVPLATFNLRHFRAVPGLKLVQPYAR